METVKDRFSNNVEREGLQFECQGSGTCCVSRGSYGYVYLTLKDRRRLAKHFKLSTSAFTKRFCRQEGPHYVLKGERPECVFMVGRKCGVYSARPEQCRAWPFWPENLNSKTWNQEIAPFCPGIGKGKTYSAKEIAKIISNLKESEGN